MTTRPKGTDSAKVISVIETKSLRGCGTEGDPCRIVTQYWSLEGKFLAEHDGLNESMDVCPEHEPRAEDAAVNVASLKEGRLVTLGKN